MKTKNLFRLIHLFAVSCFIVGCANNYSIFSSDNDVSSEPSQSSQISSSINQSFESVPLNYEIQLINHNDYVDFDYLSTNLTYLCNIALAEGNTLDGEPVFTYDHDLADIIVASPNESGLGYRYFTLIVKDKESSKFELKIEWRKQTLTKTYSIVKNIDLANCLYDYENSSNQRADYDDYSVIDSEEKYTALKNAVKNYIGGYQFPSVTFDNSFLLVRYYYVSGYAHYKYNQCFIFKEKLVIDYHEQYRDGDVPMVVSGTHFTLLELPNAYKDYQFITHLSGVKDLK